MTKHRTTDTADALAGALSRLMLSRPFQKITINEICEEADVSRSTFYLHFEDKYSFFSYCLENQIQSVLQQVRGESPKAFFLAVLTRMQENRRQLGHLLEAGPDEEMVTILHETCIRYLMPYLEAKSLRGGLIPGPPEALLNFFVGGYLAMLKYWITDDFRTSKEALASCQDRLFRELLM